MQLRQSMRRAAKMRLALAGASGSGKTYSSLLIAYGMTGDWSKVAVIDSEMFGKPGESTRSLPRWKGRFCRPSIKRYSGDDTV